MSYNNKNDYNSSQKFKTQIKYSNKFQVNHEILKITQKIKTKQVYLNFISKKNN